MVFILSKAKKKVLGEDKVLMWEFLLNILFPRRCVSCGKIGRYICSRCRSIIRIIEQNQHVCPVCERAAIGGETHPKCETKYSLDGLTSFFVYDGPIKKAIKELKYKFVTDLARELISLINWVDGDEFFHPTLSTSILQSSHSTQAIKSKGVAVSVGLSKIVTRRPFADYVLISVPLHQSRFNWRGFNQAEILGKMIAEKLEISFVPNLLIRKRATKPQVELKGKERKENIIGAFAVNPRYSDICHPASDILLFDDVWTTGTTLRTCGRVLKEAGVKRVWGLTLAR